jgi:excisionase family DNA binding protein
MRLWVSPIPRPLRWYDLRHTNATLLRKAGVDLGAVQRSLGHSSPGITAEIYDHSDATDYRAEMERALTFEDPGRVNATSMQSSEHPNEGAPGAVAFASDSGGLKWSGRQDLNLRPLGPEGPNADPHGLVPGHLESYPVDNIGVEGGAGSHTVAPIPPVATPFGALVVRGEVRQLLTVREVAARLRVSRATVYRLVQAGALPVLRISNSIRIPEGALTP